VGHLEISIQNPDSKPIVITDASRLEIEVPEDLLSLPDLRLIQLETQSETNWTLVVKDNNVLQLKLKPGRTISISKDSPAIVLLQGALAPIGRPWNARSRLSGPGLKDQRQQPWIPRRA